MILGDSYLAYFLFKFSLQLYFKNGESVSRNFIKSPMINSMLFHGVLVIFNTLFTN